MAASAERARGCAVIRDNRSIGERIDGMETSSCDQSEMRETP